MLYIQISYTKKAGKKFYNILVNGKHCILQKYFSLNMKNWQKET